MKNRVKSPPFLVLAANTPWVYALAENLAEISAVTAIRYYDWMTYRRLRPAWPLARNGVRQILHLEPPGYAGRFSMLCRPHLARAVRREAERLRRETGKLPYVICPYPYLAPWVRDLPADRLIYYNLDEYSFYDPSRACETLRLERELSERASLILCLSSHQVEVLQERYPKSASRTVHFPLGVVDTFINNRPDDIPSINGVGYVGNLTNRVDWPLVIDVARRCPATRFGFAGDPDHAAVGSSLYDWREVRGRALNLPNVEYLGNIQQTQVPAFYSNYAVNWMPYDVTHGFNIASCPTKIFDALASGRPFVSTTIPECHLYPDYIHIGEDAAALSSIIEGLQSGQVSHDCARQLTFARANTWAARARQLTDLIAV